MSKIDNHLFTLTTVIVLLPVENIQLDLHLFQLSWTSLLLFLLHAMIAVADFHDLISTLQQMLQLMHNLLVQSHLVFILHLLLAQMHLIEGVLL